MAAGLGEHLATWPLTALVDRKLAGDRRAFAQSAWRHALFGLVLGELERRLNRDVQFEPLEQVPVASNGHGNIEHAAADTRRCAPIVPCEDITDAAVAWYRTGSDSAGDSGTVGVAVYSADGGTKLGGGTASYSGANATVTVTLSPVSGSGPSVVTGAASGPP